MSTSIIYPALTVSGIKNSVTSLMGSTAYLKSFVPIAVYNILYNRVEYDASYFSRHTLHNIPYTVLSKRIPKSHPLFSVYHWLKAAMEDIEKKFMKELYLIVRDKETKEVIEYYCFAIQYTDRNGMPASAVLSKEVMEKTSRIFETISLLSGQEKLNNDNISFAMQVVLNEGAPSEHVTKSFKKSEHGYVNPGTSGTVSFGNISTGYHKLKIRAKGSVFDEDKLTDCGGDTIASIIANAEEDAEAEVETEATSSAQDSLREFNIQKVERKYGEEEKKKKVYFNGLMEKEDYELKQKRDAEIDHRFLKLMRKENLEMNRNKKTGGVNFVDSSEDEDFEVKKPIVKKRKAPAETGKKEAKGAEAKKVKAEEKNDAKDDFKNLLESESLTSSTFFQDIDDQLFRRDNRIVCLCAINFNIPSIEIIACTICKTYQHVVCGGYKIVAHVPRPHVCYNCYKTTGAKINDIRMYNAKDENMRFKFALSRLVAIFCANTDRSPAEIFDLVPEKLREDAVTDMVKYCIILKEDGKLIANMERIRILLASVMFYVDADSLQLDPVNIISIDD